MDKSRKASGKTRILQALARMLESAPGERITIAVLARQVELSEAALYRHFPSKARMLEGLIEFIENTVFMRIARVLTEESNALPRCHRILTLLLTFSDKNPGLTRLLTGEALVGETERLRARIAQFHGRIETQLAQVLREARTRENLMTPVPEEAVANSLLACCEGRYVQFVRSEFKQSPLQHWDAQWEFLSRNLLIPVEGRPLSS